MMSKSSAELQSLHPLVQGSKGVLRDLAWNVLAQFFEEPFTIKVIKASPSAQAHVRSAMDYSLQTEGKGLGILDESYGIDDLALLRAFAALVGSSAYEYAAVGLTPAGQQAPFTSIAVKKGTPSSVTVPDGALRQIKHRIKQGDATTAVFIHNHPQGILHDIFGSAMLGPSAQDRRMVTAAYRAWLGTEGRIRSVFYLVESDHFRKFVLPSVDELWNLAIATGLVRTSA